MEIACVHHLSLCGTGAVMNVFGYLQFNHSLVIMTIFSGIVDHFVFSTLLLWHRLVLWLCCIYSG